MQRQSLDIEVNVIDNASKVLLQVEEALTRISKLYWICEYCGNSNITSFNKCCGCQHTRTYATD
jgi:RNA polymerase-binding transcription factor DksA